jgi:hypothetical protein
MPRMNLWTVFMPDHRPIAGRKSMARTPESISPDTRLVLRPTAGYSDPGHKTRTLTRLVCRMWLRNGRGSAQVPNAESRWHTDGLLSVRLQ